MVNELYLTLLYRPVTGAAPTLVSRFLAREGARQNGVESSDALAISGLCAKGPAPNACRSSLA